MWGSSQAYRLARVTLFEETFRVNADASSKLSKPRADEAKRQRVERFQHGADWRHEGAFSRRHYASYTDYVTHQTAKLEKVSPALLKRFETAVELFRRRFELLDLPPASSVLCLGARLGQEVEAFIRLGHFAIGIDLNPGPENPYVVVGDFHRLVFADHSVDCVYINSVDHILDVRGFCGEAKRVLKPNGRLVADIVHGYEEGFWAGEFEVIHWPTASGFADEFARLGGLEIASKRDLGDVGSPLWLQCVFAAGERST